MAKQRVLVTGGAGYIGSHTCKLLATEGYDPIVVDNLSTGNKWAVKWGPLEICDIRDDDALSLVMDKYKPEAVAHFASCCYVGESVENPEKYYNNNVSGMLSLLKTMNRKQVRKIIFSSSCSTYGNPQYIPIDETHPQTPINPYGFTKYICERILSDYHRTLDIDFVALRYFNAAGADPEAEIGELHEPEPHLVPRILNAALGKTDHFLIHGTDYDTDDGTCVRDYVHVLDIAKAHLKAIEHILKSNSAEFINLGNGSGFSVKEVVNKVLEITGSKIKVVEGDRRDGDPAILISDSQRASEILNWSPDYPDLTSIITHAWQWHQSKKSDR